MDSAKLIIKVEENRQGSSTPPPGSLLQPRQLAEATRPPWQLPPIPAPQILNPGQTARITDEAIAAARKMATTVGSIATLPPAPPLPALPAAPKLPGLPSLPTPASTQPHATLPALEASAMRLPAAPDVYRMLPPEAGSKTIAFGPGTATPPVQAGAAVSPPVPAGAAQQPAQPGGWLTALNDKLAQASARLQAPPAPALPQLPTPQLPGALGKLAQVGGAASSAMNLVSGAMSKMLPVVGPLVQGLELAVAAIKAVGVVARAIGEARAASATERGGGWAKWFDDRVGDADSLVDNTMGRVPIAGDVIKGVRGGLHGTADSVINNSEALRLQQIKNLQFFGSSAQNAIAGDIVQSKLDQMKKQLSEVGDGFWGRTLGGNMRLREQIAALETHQRLRPAILADAQRLAPYSGELSAAQAQAQGLRIRTDVQAADRHGGSLARYVQADVEYESALKNAMGPMKEAILKQSAALAEAQGDSGKLHEVLTQLKDDSAFLKLIREDAGKTAEFNKRMLEELKKIREDNQRSRMDGDDILRQLRDGVQLLDHINTPEDPLDWNAANAIRPLE